jgi:hypothetical protein
MNRFPARRSLAAIGTLALTGVVLAPLPAASTDAAPVEGLTWQSITFGQSTDLTFSANVLPEKVGTNHAEPDLPGTLEGEIFMESRGGKLAPGHDGLTFYHVTLDPNEHNFVLEADVTVHQLGPETGSNPNGQEGAGLMVRDVNGAARQDPMLPGFEEVPAASNYAATSMMRAGPSALSRTETYEPWGTVGSVFTNARLATGATNSTYQQFLDQPVRMRLERTDTSFVMSSTFSYDGEEHTSSRTLEGADWVQDIDPGTMTVGFFASRNVAVTFSDASLTLSPANTQPRPPTPEPVTPVTFQVTSPQHSGTAAYPFRARAAYDGTIDVVVDGEPVVEQAAMTAGEDVAAVLPLASGTHGVTATYTPSDPAAPSTAPITRSLSVDVREYAAGDALIAGPDGTPDGDGTSDSPLDLVTAIRYVLPAQAVELLGGTYTPSSNVVIAAPYSGTAGAPKTLRPHDGAEVTFDGRGTLSRVVQLDADHWHLADLHVTGSASNGVRVSGSHNVLDGLLVNFNGNTGVQLSGTGADPATWPAHNLVVGTESHDNRDAADINADGFAAKLGVGPGNVFRDNVAHHNIDDGWDLYNRTNEGPNFPMMLEGNIAYSNGKLSDGYNEDSNVGVGFKLGGEGLPVTHVVTGNLAFDNNLDGFSDNFNPGRLEVSGNTAVDNRRFNYIFRINPYFASDEQGVFRDNLSLRTDGAGADHRDWVSGVVDATDFFSDGTRTVSSSGAVLVGKRDVVSLDAPASYPRDDDGAIVWGDFARPTFRSVLATAGTDGGHVGALAPAERPGKVGARR